VLLKDFKEYVGGVTAQIRGAAETIAHAAGRRVHYLRSSAPNKEAFIAELRRREEGVCVKHWLNKNCFDAALLTAVNRGEFALGGLRNRDVRALLYPTIPDGLTPRQLAGRVSRQLSLLRAHGLIPRLGESHRYKVTTKGRTIITAFLAAAQADTAQLTKLAA